MEYLEKLKFNADGIIPAIIQDAQNRRVLMMAWMKGESSGHTQKVVDCAYDCDGDTLLLQVEQEGAACHEGYRSCFFSSIKDQVQNLEITEPMLKSPKEIYGSKK